MNERPRRDLVALAYASGEFAGYFDLRTAEFLGEVSSLESSTTITTTRLYHFPPDVFGLHIVQETDLLDHVVTFENWKYMTPEEAVHWFASKRVSGGLPPCLERIVANQIGKLRPPVLPNCKNREGREVADDFLTAKTSKRSTERGEGCNDDNAVSSLLRVFTNGLADERVKKAELVLQDDNLTIEEKLTKIDALIRFPATASASKLGDLFGVTKQAVMKTEWWKTNRRGEKDSEIGRRYERHRERTKQYEPDPNNDEDDYE